MNKYLLINPVAEKMYGEKFNIIKETLIKKGYIMVECEAQLEYVKNQYKEYAKKIENTMLDCRCPESINLLKRNNLISGFEVPMIEPILVRTCRVLYEKYIKSEEDMLIVTCPCTQLRDFASEKFKDKDNAVFYTWKEFAEREGIKSLGKIDESPIPLGYFKDSFEKVLEVSSEDEILSKIQEIKNGSEDKYDIVEMFYCKDGCNNGDGL
ncbi:hypothetical protein [Clostridioides sp. ZZV15-6388]|uniref:hypothetical protein n=1 Tax=unclassified Clostridioides TaxID=2635829 RepID=UPI001D12D965|nr:hypothetical protein [Clostridioides sp. ZZV15-6388]MCC0665499.1 hypothetical protein [Clostridioides sp. ZZV15-6597]